MAGVLGTIRKPLTLLNSVVLTESIILLALENRGVVLCFFLFFCLFDEKYIACLPTTRAAAI